MHSLILLPYNLQMRDLLCYASVQGYNYTKYSNKNANLTVLNYMPYLPSKHLGLTIVRD